MDSPTPSITVAIDGPLATPDGVLLLPGRAAFLPASCTLLVADLHLGKAATFRHAGLPVPEGSAQADLDRLGRLLAATSARRLVVLGDLLHAAVGCTPAVIGGFRALRDRFPAVSFVLVLGNHDGAARRHAGALGLDVCATCLDEPPFHLVHDAGGDGGTSPPDVRLTIAGHVHPRASVAGPSGGRVTQRCFHLGRHARRNTLLLPAFGSFTGGAAIDAAPGDRVWMAADDAVVDVTALLGTRRERPGGVKAPTPRPRAAPPPGRRPDRAR